jgi:hypothetical protein
MPAWLELKIKVLSSQQNLTKEEINRD